MEDFTLMSKTITLVGKRCSGKSYTLKHSLMHELHTAAVQLRVQTISVVIILQLIYMQ